VDLVLILRELWRKRLLVAIAGILAVVVGMAVAYQLPSLSSRQYDVGVATARALLDTPSSAVADLGGEEGNNAVGALPGRAALLANLLTSAPLKDEIAKRAGVPPSKLIANTPALAATTRDRRVDDRTAFTLTVQNEVDLPLLTVMTQAPDAQTAQRLANSAVAILNQHVSSVAGADSVPAPRRLVVKPLGPARAGISTRGPRRMYALIAAFILFGLACTGIIVVSSLVRTWRLADVMDDLMPDDDQFGPAPDDDQFGPAPSPVPFRPADHDPPPLDADAPRAVDRGSAA
jgi:hypothetical protein